MKICQNCHLGTLRPRLTTYAAWHLLPDNQGQERSVFIVMPGVTAWTCPLCGARAFAVDALDRLGVLVGPPVKPASQAGLPGDTRQPRSSSQAGKSPLRAH